MKENENTEPVYYPVSEAVQKSGVPSHVLRYWEDELRLTIRRSPQGHRIYSEADIVMFQKVKELKDKGIQLKAIRLLLEHSENPEDSLQLGQLLDEMSGTAAETAMGAVMQKGDPDEGDGRLPEKMISLRKRMTMPNMKSFLQRRTAIIKNLNPCSEV